MPGTGTKYDKRLFAGKRPALIKSCHGWLDYCFSGCLRHDQKVIPPMAVTFNPIIIKISNWHLGF
jgi:hypothetical protein